MCVYITIGGRGIEGHKVVVAPWVMAVVAIFYPSILNQVHPTRSLRGHSVSFDQEPPRCCASLLKLWARVSVYFCRNHQCYGCMAPSFVGFFFKAESERPPQTRRHAEAFSDCRDYYLFLSRSRTSEFAILRVFVRVLRPHFVSLYVNLRVLTAYCYSLSFALQ